MNINDLERRVCLRGMVCIDFHGFDFEFDLSMPHERRYFLRALFSLPYAQADIDTFLFSRFIRSGDRVLDAGANIGLTAREAIILGASKVVCVEPEPSLVDRLRRNLIPGMSLTSCALGAQTGRTRLFISETHNQGHTINREMLNLFPGIYGSRCIDVEVKTVDDILCGEYCDVWKLDIEGAELDILTGNIGLLPRVILAEIYGEKIRAVLDALGGRYICRRAVIQSEEYALRLLVPEPGELSNIYEKTSPMYVFVLNEAWDDYT